MINEEDNPVAWALLLSELDEAQEHLAGLKSELREAGAMDDEEFAVYLGHVYAHLNRVWHSRNQASKITKEQWPVHSQFPNDIKPVG